MEEHEAYDIFEEEELNDDEIDSWEAAFLRGWEAA